MYGVNHYGTRPFGSINYSSTGSTIYADTISDSAELTITLASPLVLPENITSASTGSNSLTDLAVRADNITNTLLITDDCLDYASFLASISSGAEVTTSLVDAYLYDEDISSGFECTSTSTSSSVCVDDIEINCLVTEELDEIAPARSVVRLKAYFRLDNSQEIGYK